MKKSCDFLIIGGGIIGLTVAKELIDRGHSNITIIEKEKTIGKHASGRNSGVLHAGIYYTPDSLKAKYCVDGNSLMKQLCSENNIDIKNCGKVIVADSKEKLDGLQKLKERADKNGVESRFIDKNELKEREPHAFTYEKAIYSPNTSVFDPHKILTALKNKIVRKNDCELLLNTEFVLVENEKEIKTNKGNIKYNFLINAAGNFAEKIAHKFNVGLKYKSIPFLGTYSKLSNDSSHLVNGNIYPVPDTRNPFLGVHFTKGVDGEVSIGPTAIPVFGRESYSFFEDLSFESISFLYRDLIMLFKSTPFRANALSEIKKYSGEYVYRECKKLIPEIKRKDIQTSNKAGIRAQLVDWDRKELVMDFVVEKKENSIHVLNAVSPAFSSSMSFAKYVADRIM